MEVFSKGLPLPTAMQLSSALLAPGPCFSRLALPVGPSLPFHPWLQFIHLPPPHPSGFQTLGLETCSNLPRHAVRKKLGGSGAHRLAREGFYLEELGDLLPGQILLGVAGAHAAWWGKGDGAAGAGVWRFGPGSDPLSLSPLVLAR